MRPKSIKQLFREYGFYETDYGFVRANKDQLCTTIRILIPKHKRNKSIRMINRYLNKGTMKMEAKNIMGVCEVPFIGFYQHIQGYRKKEYNKFSPSAFHCKEVSKIYEPPVSHLLK